MAILLYQYPFLAIMFHRAHHRLAMQELFQSTAGQYTKNRYNKSENYQEQTVRIEKGKWTYLDGERQPAPTGEISTAKCTTFGHVSASGDGQTFMTKIIVIPNNNNNTNNDNDDNNENRYYPIIPVEMVTENEGSFTCDNPNNMFHHHHSSMVATGGDSDGNGNDAGDSLTNWVVLDMLAASHLNSQIEAASVQLSCFNDPIISYCTGNNDLLFSTGQSTPLLSTSTFPRAVVSAGACAYITPGAQNYTTTTEIDLWNLGETHNFSC
ncbi:hypothetical protein PIB30_011369 [Stylosanthes scabra]|uniref:Uncharacterized protein n=1 Tax=Stylosanthes scabra TaxID=79078 RepID=A0ABU6Y580_9FABA|nr:hypothetical protein [Stylosanthes scabra]